MNRPVVLLELMRAHSAAGAALAVWLGARLAGASWASWWLLPMLVAFLLSAAGNAFNDANDAAIDAINRPQRPIPRGSATPGQARRLALACAGLALILALPFGVASSAGTVAAITLLFLYTTHLKSIPLLGNTVVGLLTGMAVGYGALLANNIPAVLLPASSLGLLFGGRELLKTIHDLPGDRANAIRTVATVAGPHVALLVASLCFTVAILFLAVWATTRPSAWPVPWLALFVSLSTVVPLWHTPEEPRAVGRALRRSKALGLAIMLVLSVV
ncbi:MAG: UbiA family prenyltransferase [Chloroflexota bacterium]|nr:UbiA family prenyltransferase [Chloroflexota bacterium]